MNLLVLSLVPTLTTLSVLLTGLILLPRLQGPIPNPRVRPVEPPQEQQVVLVRTVRGRWFADGFAVDSLTLKRRLIARGASLQIRFLPSARLTASEVGASLAWLRRHSRGGIQLELVGG